MPYTPAVVVKGAPPACNSPVAVPHTPSVGPRPTTPAEPVLSPSTPGEEAVLLPLMMALAASDPLRLRGTATPNVTSPLAAPPVRPELAGVFTAVTSANGDQSTAVSVLEQLPLKPTIRRLPE